MYNWLSVIKKTFPVLKNNSNKNNLKFEIIENINELSINIETVSKNNIAFSWKNNSFDYLVAIVEVEQCKQDDIADKLEIVLNKLFKNQLPDIYVARDVIIDDMPGFEVLGIKVLNFEMLNLQSQNTINIQDTNDIFYGLYLSDDKDGYFIVGFSNDKMEVAFDKLTSITRLFNRKNSTALIENKEYNNNEIKALRKLANKLTVDYDIDYQLLNATFYVNKGKFDKNKPISFIMLSDNEVKEIEFQNIYKKDKNFNKEVAELLANTYAYDISAFTVTLLKNGRYSVIYYPISEDEQEEYSKYDKDNHYLSDNKKEYALNYINKLHNDIFGFIKTWNNGMVLIQNANNFTTNNFIVAYPYYNIDNEPFIEINIIEDSGIDDESVKEQNMRYSKYYPAMYDYFGEKVDELNLFTVLFYFKNNGKNQVDASSLLYKEFMFDIFCAIEDGEESIESINLMAVVDIFEETFINKHLMYIFFEVVYNDKISVASDIIGFFMDSEKVLNKDILNLEDIYENIKIIFDNRINKINCNKGQFTIFPNGKIGVLFL